MDNRQTLLEAWVDSLTAKGAAARTIAGYRRDVAGFLAKTEPGEAPWSAAALAAHRDHLLAEGRPASSTARALSAIKAFCQFLKNHEVPVEDGLFSIVTTAPIQRPRPSLPQDAAFRALHLVEHLSDEPWLALRDTAVFGLLFEAGLSIGEALSLPRAAATSEGTVTVRKGTRVRQVRLPEPVQHKLAAYHAACPVPGADTDPLFVGLRGKPLDAGVVQRQMRRLRTLLDLGPETTIEALRQAIAAQLRARGKGLDEVQAMFGHRHKSSARRLVRQGRR